MIPELIAIALAAAVGYALVRRLGEGLLIGIGVCAGLLMILPWNRWAVLLACAACSAGGLLRRRTSEIGRHSFGLLDAATAVGLLGYARFATAAPLWEFDFLSDWGLKGKVFWIARRIDWSFLEQATYRATHPDYPPLLPLAFDFLALIRGAWNDSALGLLNVAFAASLLLIVRRVAMEETEWPLAASFVALAVFPLAATPWIGLGEGPFIAYATAALLLIRRDMTLAAVMLGLAAATKNEGMALIVAVALALILTRRSRDVLRLWPAAAIAAPWLVLRSLHHLPTDIAEGNVLTRMMEHLRHPGALLTALRNAPPGKPLLWIGLLIGLALVWKRIAQRDAFVVIAVALQLAFYIAAYVATPHDIEWHVRWSWERLIAHLTPALATVVLMHLAAQVRKIA